MDRPTPDAALPLPFLQDGIAQIALIVEDLDRTVEDYWRTFGVGPWHFYTYAAPLLRTMSYRGQPGDYAIRIALTWFGPSRIELIEVQRGDSVYAEFVAEQGTGVQHLGVLVDDMAAAIAQARAAGIEMIQDGSGFGADGDGHFAYLDTRERFGVTFELIQRPKGRLKPERIYPPED
jgi:catechol 2,3-dioxygenase-like lactoylglutathione lyase family enzyme